MILNFCLVFQCEKTIDHAYAPDSCSRYDGSWCDLVCQEGYMRKTATTNMTSLCSLFGWDIDNNICIGNGLEGFIMLRC